MRSPRPETSAIARSSRPVLSKLKTTQESCLPITVFGLRNLPKLSKRPSVAVGHMNNGNFPNFHTLGLLRVTDVVSLSSFPKEADPNPGLDRVYFDLIKDSFPRICRFFPKGFKPDLFWDWPARLLMVTSNLEGLSRPLALRLLACVMCSMFTHATQSLRFLISLPQWEWHSMSVFKALGMHRC